MFESIKSLFMSDEARILNDIKNEQRKISAYQKADKKLELETEAKAKAEAEAQAKAKAKAQKAQAFLVSFEALADEADARKKNLEIKTNAYQTHLSSIQETTREMKAEADASMKETLEKIKERQKNRRS